MESSEAFSCEAAFDALFALPPLFVFFFKGGAPGGLERAKERGSALSAGKGAEEVCRSAAKELELLAGTAGGSEFNWGLGLCKGNGGTEPELLAGTGGGSKLNCRLGLCKRNGGLTPVRSMIIGDSGESSARGKDLKLDTEAGCRRTAGTKSADCLSIFS